MVVRNYVSVYVCTLYDHKSGTLLAEFQWRGNWIENVLLPAVGPPERLEPAREGRAVDDLEGFAVVEEGEGVGGGVGGRQVRQLTGPAAEAAVRVLAPKK